MSSVHAVVVNAGSTSVKVTSFATASDDGTRTSLDDALGAAQPRLVVHRVVHGGARTEAAVLDDDVVAELRALIDVAPLHQPPALDAIERCRRRWPDVRQIACFDTAFHAGIPEAARTYALPERLRSRVRAYGFHGLSHAWSARQVAELAPGAQRVLVAHLGGGQSLCAISAGRSISTTMGFTPLDGLVMATRSGAVDPGALLWLARNTDEDLATVLERESGLLGLAGTDDMATVVSRAAAGDRAAVLALDVWTHRFTVLAGGCVAVLGGLDALVFTGGVGEHSAAVRDRACRALAWAGVSSGEGRSTSRAGTFEISAVGAPVRTFVVEAREDRQMLDEAARPAGR